jgi:hypothetical protein
VKAKRSLALLAAVPPLAAVAWLLSGVASPERVSSAPRAIARTEAAPREIDARDLGPVVTVKAEGHASPAPTPARAVRTPTQDERALESALVEADKPTTGVRELQDLGSTLDRLLGQRPELGPAAARALGHLSGREVLFQVERALRGVASDPEVHATLMALAAGGGSDSQREAAIGALGGREDRAADVVFTGVLADASAGPLARSAAAYELPKELDLVPDVLRDGAVASARSIVSDARADVRVQTEAWGVLGAKGLDGSDRALARATIDRTDTTNALALAAAHALLDSGESRAQVARALAPRGRDEPVLAAMLAKLEAGR